MGCNNRDKIVYDPKIVIDYSILERKNYREAPDFDYIKKERNSLNREYDRAYKKIDNKSLTSFITLNSLEKEKAIVYFSNDTLAINKYLQIIILDKEDNLLVTYKDKVVLPTHRLLHINFYYIPVEKLGKNTVSIEGFFLRENFHFFGVKDRVLDEMILISNYHRDRMNKLGGIDIDSLGLR